MLLAFQAMISRVCIPRQRAHPLATWVAILAMMLHALWPGLARVQSGPLALMVEVCSALGSKKVTVSAAPDSPPSNPDQATHQGTCAVCSLACAIGLPPALAPLFFSALQSAALSAAPVLISHDTSLALPTARGPPLES